MKLLLASLILVLSGCSTLGEVEAFNDAGLGEVTSGMRAYTKTLNVLGVTSQTNSAGHINRAYGHVKNMNVVPRNVEDVPFGVRDVQELMRYLK